MKQTDGAGSDQWMTIMYFEIDNLLLSEVLPVKSTFPVLKSTSFTVLSFEALASSSPLGLHRTQLISSRINIQTLIFKQIQIITGVNSIKGFDNLRFALIKYLDIASVAARSQ